MTLRSHILNAIILARSHAVTTHGRPASSQEICDAVMAVLAEKKQTNEVHAMAAKP